MSHVLVGAFVIAGALAFAGVGSRSSSSSSSSFPSTPTPEIAPELPSPAPVAPATAEPVRDAEQHAAAPKPVQTIKGEALETLEVPEYTYIRMGQKGAADIWVAVASAKVKVGEQVSFESQTVMTNFTSPKLKRTFEQIHFGTLAGQDEAQAPAEKPAGAPIDGDVPIGTIEKATGPNGMRIVELFAKKKSLAGKTARIRAVVVKVTNDVMGKNFAHIRDGSGSEAQHDNDLTVTTNENLERGQTVLLEGKVTVDKDLGAGYHYDVLLEDATRPK